MAVETTTRGVLPSGEAYTIEEYEGFGWQLVSSQPTKNNVGMDIVRLTFSRDTEMEHYDKLKSSFEIYLEKEEEMKAISRQQDEMGDAPEKPIFSVPRAVVSFIFGVFGFVCYYVSYKRKMKDYETYRKTYDTLQARFDQLDRECEELLVEAKELTNYQEKVAK